MSADLTENARYNADVDLADVADATVTGHDPTPNCADHGTPMRQGAPGYMWFCPACVGESAQEIAERGMGGYA